MNKEKTKKMFLFGTILIIATMLCIQTSVYAGTDENPITPTPLGMAGWSDGFDTYSDGQFLDGGDDDGGWVGWDDLQEAGAFVTSAQAHSAPHSLACEGPTDLIHQWTEFTSGVWNFSSWLFVPDDFEGGSYFIMLSRYSHGGGQEGNKWAVQLEMSSFDQVVVSQHQGFYLPLITGRWVEFLCVIDLDQDWVDMYYDGQLLDYREWTGGPNAMPGDGDLNIACLDIFADGASVVYWDDIYIRPFGSEPKADLVASGNLIWVNQTAGGTINTEIIVANGVGGTQLDWEIESFPDFGDWTFNPSSGENLEGSVTVDVTFVVPSDTEAAFSGEVKIVNSEDSGDFVIIPVSLTTPKNKAITPFLNFLEQHPNMFPLLRHLVGL